MVTLSVSNNGASASSAFYSPSTLSYTYHPNLRLEGVYPPMGPSSGNFSGRILGGPFPRAFAQDVTADGRLRCRFGETVVAGNYVSGEEIECRAPAHVPGQCALEVSLNGQVCM